MADWCNLNMLAVTAEYVDKIQESVSPLPTTISTTISPPDIPQVFKNIINEMGGNELFLLIQKVLHTSDLSQQQSRLSMPMKQIKNKDFLRRHEEQVLDDKKAMQVPLIQPLSLDITDITLAKWVLPKSPEKRSYSYVLRSSWTKVAEANQLKLNDIVQVWSFRVQDQLHMALVKVIP